MSDDIPADDLGPVTAADRAVVGAVLLAGRRVLDDLAEAQFDPSDFYLPKHEAIFRAALDLAAAGDAVDPITVANRLGSDLARFGGPAYLHHLLEACLSPSAAVHYAMIIERHATLRRLSRAGRAITQMASGPDDGGALPAIVDAAQGEIAAVADRVHGRSTPDDMAAALDDVIDRLDRGGAPAVATGIKALDDMLVGGLQVGTLTTIAARPGAGKTVVGLQVALGIALSGAHVGLTTLEMSRQDLLVRAIASLGKVDYGRLQRSPGEPLTESEWRAVSQATERIRSSGLHLSHRRTATVATVRNDIRSLVRDRGSCSAWVVDYLQLLAPADRRAPREQQVAQMSRSLKATALELGVPIVLLAQLNRDGEKTGRAPVITDIRESGAIEQDSDNVLLLHRTEAAPDVINVALAKNRRGPQGRLNLAFQGEYQRVAPLLASMGHTPSCTCPNARHGEHRSGCRAA